MIRQRVGDLLLGFGTALPSAGRARPMPWLEVASDAEWRLWQQPVSPGWKGYPLMEIRSAAWRIWLLGELYGPDRFVDTAVRSLGELVRGERSAAQLNGHWLVWAWKEDRRQWHCWTNRFGTLHAYRAGQGNHAAVGTSFRSVARLASGGRLDWPALTGFFGFGFFPEDRTFYDDVRILQPASHYVFTEKGATVGAQRYWEWRHAPASHRSYHDTVAELASVFGRVMAELLESADGRMALPLSGGLDSRSTAAALDGGLSPRAIERLWAYSYGYAGDSCETRTARLVANARGLPFAAFTIGPYLFDRLDDILGAVEGFQDLTQCRQAFVTPLLRQQVDSVIAAHWGDVWLDDMGFGGTQGQDYGATDPRLQSVVSRQLLRSLLQSHTLNKLSKSGRVWLLEQLCAPQVEQPEALLAQWVKSGLDRLQHLEDPDFRLKAFKTDHWSFRWTTTSLRMFQSAAFPRLPFYDTRLTDFFATVPTSFLRGRQLQVDYLKQYAPDLARIEWPAAGADLFHCQRPELWRLARRAGNKIQRLLAGRAPVERNWQVQFQGAPGQAGLRHWLLRPGLRLHDLVPRRQIAALLDEFHAAPLVAGRGYTVSMLLTFSVWLQWGETTDD